ncbi:unnamed protein product, partial [Mesorhabditis spiculigera]
MKRLFGIFGGESVQQWPSIFSREFDDAKWLADKTNGLLHRQLENDNFLALTNCLNSSINILLPHQPFPVTKAISLLQTWEESLEQHRALSSSTIDFSKGLFFRRAADVLFAKQIKAPLPDPRVVLVICTLLELSIAYLDVHYDELGSERKTLMALELLEASALLKKNLHVYGKRSDLSMLLSMNMQAEMCRAFEADFPSSFRLFEELPSFRDIDGEKVAKYTRELWNMRANGDFLRRASWLIHYEKLCWPAVHQWFVDNSENLPTVERFSSLDYEMFFVMCGAYGAANQMEDLIFPATIQPVHQLTTDQLKAWDAMHALLDGDKKSAFLYRLVQEVTCLKKPPQGARLVHAVYEYLKEFPEENVRKMGVKYAHYLTTLLMRLGVTTVPNSVQLFPSNAPPFTQQEEEIIQEELACHIALSEAGAGKFEQAEGRLKAFTGKPSREALLEVYAVWSMHAASEEEKDEINEKTDDVRMELYGQEKLSKPRNNEQTSPPRPDAFNMALHLLNSGQASQEKPPRRSVTASDTTSPLLPSGSLDNSFVSAVSQLTPGSPQSPGSVNTAKSVADDSDLCPSTFMESQSDPVEEAVSLAVLQFLEGSQKHLNDRLKVQLQTQAEILDEAKEYTNQTLLRTRAKEMEHQAQMEQRAKDAERRTKKLEEFLARHAC